MINIRMQMSHVQKLTPKITVVGVGGAGGNAVNNMIASGLEGCSFLVTNTDAQALEQSLCENRLQLGVHVTSGLGAGANPEMGRQAAEETIDEVMQFLEGSNMAFITAGMGGGTGTGAAPVIARACREAGILTVGVVTKPFHFEGTHRMKLAEAGIHAMQGYVDTLIVIPNQNLFRVANERTTFAEAFKMADSVLQSGVRGVTDLMVMPGLINLDFADIRSAMQEMGKAMMGTGEAEGDRRAIEAAEAAINNPLLDDVTMKGARGVIINVTGGYDMTLFEVDEACNRIRDEVDPNANIIFGSTFDQKLEGRMRVSVVATGIDAPAVQRSPVSGGVKVTAVSQTPPAPEKAAAPARSAMAPGVPASLARAPIPTRPAVTAASYSVNAALAAATAAARRIEEPEADMFEQQEFADVQPAAPQPQTQTYQNPEAVRASRYGESFIPPRPVMVDNPSPVPSGYGPQGAPQRPAYQEQPSTSGMVSGMGLNLRPPVPGANTAQRRRGPSLFERITGAHRHADPAPASEAHTEPQQHQSQGGSHMSLRAPQRPMQGQLAIDSPSAPAQQDDQLDIPAFLRRQAN